MQHITHSPTNRKNETCECTNRVDTFPSHLWYLSSNSVLYKDIHKSIKLVDMFVITLYSPLNILFIELYQ
ncbi:hypothetical protein EUGRSUZ_I01554 [Eucalyptus grandis]|uniref:Uncharacterized protein n=2 Tax=Eucalyptus grandis TaxID=71139 RepID=A0ACC3JG50_EUCGR|nr:hypothetical protein EUGRSUZ_I01554 [Eucalyptus grandis]